MVANGAGSVDNVAEQFAKAAEPFRAPGFGSRTRSAADPHHHSRMVKPKDKLLVSIVNREKDGSTGGGLGMVWRDECAESHPE